MERVQVDCFLKTNSDDRRINVISSDDLKTIFVPIKRKNNTIIACHGVI
jgi:hypothetical protein